MLPLKSRLIAAQKSKNAHWETVELDYTLSLILISIARHQLAAKSLIFKGGTALKKCYFGSQYRFSQDLDFTLVGDLSKTDLDQVIEDITNQAGKIANSYDQNISFTVKPYKEQEPHPHDQQAYIIKAQLPWHSQPLTKIKLEISRDELIVKSSVLRTIIHEYGESFKEQLQVYALEEILAEKYRGLLQNQQKMQQRTWIRSRVRDFYDLWHILDQFRHELDLTGFKDFFIQKCRYKGVEFSSPDQFFEPNYLNRIKSDWEQFLSMLIEKLPEFDELVNKLKILTNKVFLR